jgi:hypothetical protein
VRRTYSPRHQFSVEIERLWNKTSVSWVSTL